MLLKLEMCIGSLDLLVSYVLELKYVFSAKNG